MRAPALIFHCFPGLLTRDKTTGCVSIVSEGDLNLPSPVVEIIPSKNAHPYKYAGEKLDVQGLNIFKGRVSVADMIGVSSADMNPSKSDGSLRYWESSINLVNVLKHEIRDGQLNFRGKRVLELGCGSGLAGILACSKGASTVHFQDPNAETLRCRTIPNALANLEQARDRQWARGLSDSPTPTTPPNQQLPTSDVHFYAGDWDELHMVLSTVQNHHNHENQSQREGLSVGMSLSLSEDELCVMDGWSSSREGSGRRSRKLSGSQAWERGSEIDQADGGYDVILISDLPFSIGSLRKLYALITKCLRPPYGVLYLAAKKNLVGSNGWARQLRALIDEEGVLGAHLVTELSDREIWKLFFK